MAKENGQGQSLGKSLNETRSGNAQGGGDVTTDLSGLTFTESGHVVESGSDAQGSNPGSSNTPESSD